MPEENCALNRRRYHKGVSCFSSKAMTAVARAMAVQNYTKATTRRNLHAAIRANVPGAADDLRWSTSLSLPASLAAALREELAPVISDNARLNEAWLSDDDLTNVLTQLENDKVRRFSLLFRNTASLFAPNQRARDLYLGKRRDAYKHLPDTFFRDRKTRVAWLYNKGDNHWTAAFFSRATMKLEYFDSFGTRPSPRSFIDEHLRFMATKFKDILQKDVRIVYHERVLQHDAFQCGAWALAFVLSRCNVSLPSSDGVGVRRIDVTKDPVGRLCAVVRRLRRYLFRAAPAPAPAQVPEVVVLD